MSNFTHKKRCDTCDELRGYSAFEKGKSTCRRCTATLIVIDSNKGIKTPKTCTKCGETKDAYPDFGYNKQHQVIHTNCKECRRLYQLAYSRDVLGYKRPMRCIKSFVFEGKQLCSECDTVRPTEHFHKGRTTCKVCVGAPLDEAEKARRLEERKANGFYGKNPVKYRPLNDDGEMECKTCGWFKPLSEFHKCEKCKGAYGHQSECKSCRYNRDRPRKGKDRFVKYFNENKERIFKSKGVNA